MSLLSSLLPASRPCRAGLFLAVAALSLAVSADRAFARQPAIGGSPSAGGPGVARPAVYPPAPPVGWTFKGIFKLHLTRTRAIQGAAACMVLGLFILMKKFADVGGGVGRGVRGPRGSSEDDRAG